MDTRLEFYDPLYETVIFERGLPRREHFVVGAKPGEYPLDPRDMIRTADFARLAFLRQAGLAWLAFPSATHTRFAHSIGCWWLGRIAESLIQVRISPTEPRKDAPDECERLGLQRWLERAQLREEFYLALLFHDLGHGPFSHVLERNPAFEQGLREAGLEDTDHEHRGVALVMGEGPLAQIWDVVARERYGPDITTLGSTLQALRDVDLPARVCLPAIQYLITGNARFLTACRHGEPHQSQLPIVKELVSGVLDLDRLDHYARDSYFSGLRQVSVNVRGFLSNLRLHLVGDASSGAWVVRDWSLVVSDDGASYAASLLFSKRQIVNTMFRNRRTLALHAMINWALTSHLECLAPADRRIACLRIALMEDDQLLDVLTKGATEGCQRIAQRIRACRPYSLVCRWTNTDVRGRRDVKQRNLEELAAKMVGENSEPAVILHTDDCFWQKKRLAESRDWLSTDLLFAEDGSTPLTQHPEHRNQFEYLRDAENVRSLWVFARDKERCDDIKQVVDDLLKKP